jgi:hypothetical protein
MSREEEGAVRDEAAGDCMTAVGEGESRACCALECVPVGLKGEG